jgi:hypothetical protein
MIQILLMTGRIGAMSRVPQEASTEFWGCKVPIRGLQYLEPHTQCILLDTTSIRLDTIDEGNHVNVWQTRNLYKVWDLLGD